MRLEDGFEGTGAKSPKPSCHFTRGLVSGACQHLLGRPTACEETKCVALGDPYCQFEVSADEGRAP